MPVNPTKSLMCTVSHYYCQPQGETESTLASTEEYKNANEALNSYYELHGGQLVMEAEAEPKDLREDDF